MLTYVTTVAALVAEAYASTTAVASENFIKPKSEGGAGVEGRAEGLSGVPMELSVLGRSRNREGGGRQERRCAVDDTQRKRWPALGLERRYLKGRGS